MTIRISLLLVLALVAPSLLPCCFAQSDAALLRQVKTIHVGSMGQGNEAEHFRSLMKNELLRVGFDAADKPEDADAVLSGTSSSEVHGDKAMARATVTLKTRAGRQIWSGDYVSQHAGQGANNTVQDTAANCAERLRKDWEKAAAASK
jgi:hypothetical protein